MDFRPYIRISLAPDDSPSSSACHVIHRARSLRECREFLAFIGDATPLDAAEAIEAWCVDTHIRVEGSITVDGEPWEGTAQDLYSYVLPPTLVQRVALRSAGGRWQRCDLGEYSDTPTPSPTPTPSATDAPMQSD